MNYAPIQNKYYKWYLSICQAKQSLNRHKKNNDGLNKHHIIPDSFYIGSKRKSKNGWLEGNPNSPHNIVYLTNKEHFLVHWLLCKCYEGLAYYKVCNAFNYMCKGDKNSKYYDIARKLLSDSLYQPKIQLVCEICNSVYEVIPFRKESKYCSLTCNGLAKMGNKNPSYKGHIEKTCCKCGNNYTIPLHREKTNKFCSRLCADTGRI